jgi:tRNA(Ile)-lysidine synthase
VSISNKSFSASLFSIVEKNKKLLIAISGGIDSEVLLDLCIKNIALANIHAIHINHNLTLQAKKYEHFVRRNCFGKNIPLTVVSEKRNSINGESMEMWGRKIRYKNIYQSLIELNFDYALTAHHASDNLETVLMNLDRGCYVKGLRGIVPKNGKIIRPLLKYKKSDIISYANKNKIDFIHDLSNDDIAMKRNYIRKKLEPSLARKNSPLIERFREISKSAQKAIKRENVLMKLIANNVRNEKDYPFFLRDQELASFNNYFKIRLIKELIGEQDLSWSRHKQNSLKSFIYKSITGSKFEINKKWILLRDRTKWILYINKHKKIKINIDGFGTHNFAGTFFSFKKTNKRSFNRDANIELIDLDIIKNKNIQIRNWTNGDKFQPLGMNGNKKVSDYLIDKKVDGYTKQRQLVVTANDEIVWLCGQIISNKFKITNRTSNMLELSMN